MATTVQFCVGEYVCTCKGIGTCVREYDESDECGASKSFSGHATVKRGLCIHITNMLQI